MGIWSITIAVLVVICGILAAAECLVKKRPDAAHIIDKLKPYQGGIGCITCLWGLWSFIWALVTLRNMPDDAGAMWLWWITYLLTAIVAVLLGFMLGFGWFSKKFLAATPDGEETCDSKGDQLVAKLEPYRIPLGKAGLLLGLWCILAAIIWAYPSPLFVGVIKSLILLLIGVLAAAALIAKKQPEAGKALEKLLPYQGIIGTLACISGILTLIYALRIVGMIDTLSDHAAAYAKASKYSTYAIGPRYSSAGLWVWWISFLILNLYTIVLGFLLGFPLIKKYVLSGSCCGSDSCCSGDAPVSECASDSETGESQIEGLVNKLTGLQIKLGLAAIGLAVWGFIATLIWAP